ncbi:Spo11/DNA topoisomerase VI subunit A like protein [Aduncisulcus paluster]|uniref:DNA topoisomerase (ATP-hydrolyzing) n=1 Tax=Aduncisulcus paluster TaxID=2918883 RepID=A0ABQ5K395_9EUKA|nr:Spo11/DNA topoisomerase VI subunit A like protein [Aduncisulcus paluster]
MIQFLEDILSIDDDLDYAETLFDPEHGKPITRDRTCFCLAKTHYLSPSHQTIDREKIEIPCFEQMESEHTKMEEIEFSSSDKDIHDIFEMVHPLKRTSFQCSQFPHSSLHKNSTSKESITIVSKRVNFFCLSQSIKFSQILLQISHINSLFHSNKHATKRELYYTHIAFFRSQKQSDEILDFICDMFGVQLHELRVCPSVKGFICGNMNIRMKRSETNEEMMVNSISHIESISPQGLSHLKPSQRETFDKLSSYVSLSICNDSVSLPPPFPSLITSISSDASCIIVVEKDTVFQHLFEAKIVSQLNAIMVTGRGYPDTVTQSMLYKLTQHLPHLPVFFLVDGDPYGLEIALTYACGTLGTSKTSSDQGTTDGVAALSDRLSGLGARGCGVGKGTLLGVSVPDMKRVSDRVRVPLSKRDVEKCHHVQGRVLNEQRMHEERKKHQDIDMFEMGNYSCGSPFDIHFSSSHSANISSHHRSSSSYENFLADVSVSLRYMLINGYKVELEGYSSLGRDAMGEIVLERIRERLFLGLDTGEGEKEEESESHMVITGDGQGISGSGLFLDGHTDSLMIPLSSSSGVHRGFRDVSKAGNISLIEEEVPTETMIRDLEEAAECSEESSCFSDTIVNRTHINRVL